VKLSQRMQTHAETQITITADSLNSDQQFLVLPVSVTAMEEYYTAVIWSRDLERATSRRSRPSAAKP
jgi:hypothetical protein